MIKLILIFILMILGHLVADYPLQGWLAQAKQKEYWEKFDPMYSLDYIPALVSHSLMWAIIMMLPLFMLETINPIFFAIALFSNIVIHCIVDDLKANKKVINLIVDQGCHLLQIITTFVLALICV